MSVCAACISLCLSRWGSCAVMASLSLKGLCNNLWCRLSLPELQKIVDSHRPRIWPYFKQTWHNLFRLTISNRAWISSDINCSHSASSWSLERRRLAPLPSGSFFPPCSGSCLGFLFLLTQLKFAFWQVLHEIILINSFRTLSTSQTLLSAMHALAFLIHVLTRPRKPAGDFYWCSNSSADSFIFLSRAGFSGSFPCSAGRIMLLSFRCFWRFIWYSVSQYFLTI